MLSYRHAFHAGNPADILKHLVLIEVLDYLAQKDKPLTYIDTHAGAGKYSLGSPEARKNQEFSAGFDRLTGNAKLHPSIDRFLKLVLRFRKEKNSKIYPGSPLLALQLLRDFDTAWFFELHPTDFELLEQTIAGYASVHARKEDGFHGLLGLLPPASRRGCVLIDPPYEIKSDFGKVIDTLIDAHRRFSTGTYLLWYPIVDRKRVNYLEKRLLESGIGKISLFELQTQADNLSPHMTGSGMICINAPWGLQEKMADILPLLASLLATGEGSGSRCLSLSGEQDFGS